MDSKSVDLKRFPKDGYSIFQGGSHAEGNFIRVYVPDSAVQGGGHGEHDGTPPLKTLIYLHGFALSMPRFYGDHLVELVKNGYIIFFPDFQVSDYPDAEPGEDPSPRDERNGLLIWYQLMRRLLFPKAGIELILSWFVRLRLAAGLTLLLFFLQILSLWRATIFQNLISLISTVALSLVSAPTEWLSQVINGCDHAWDQIAKDSRYAHWANTQPQAYAFGHSLGGLLALSLPWGYGDAKIRAAASTRLQPQQIVVADPAASTLMGMPPFVVPILKLFRLPFTSQPITITDSGVALKVPVTILHGEGDTLVPPGQWIDPIKQFWPWQAAKPCNFLSIASTEKAIYASCSNPNAQPPLVSFHNQAVTNTTYYDDELFNSFGGVKTGPNAYNFNYIWPAVLLLLSGKAQPGTVLDDLLHPDFGINVITPNPIE
jgi:hypothetical protein